MKQKRTSGSKWTTKEKDLLKAKVLKHGAKKGFQIASNQLKIRTNAACKWQYYQHCR